jgi:superfamily II DNA or RNA helicase
LTLVNILNAHDEQDPRHKHKAIVLTKTIEEADEFAAFVNGIAYHGQTPNPEEALKEFLCSGRIIVVCGKLLEGFDHPTITTCVILRNVSASSHILFAQFVGRALRPIDMYDPVTTVVLSHKRYDQRSNFENFDRITNKDSIED